MPPEGLPLLLRIQMHRAAFSPATRRHLVGLMAIEMPTDERDMLAAILIVEASQRPEWAQSVEWALLSLGRVVGLPRRLLPRTVGPLQLAGGPRLFADGVAVARRRLEGHFSSFEDVATEWYGSPNRVRGASVSYVDALAHAMDLWMNIRRELTRSAPPIAAF
jgi:hypothetical protein